MPQNFSNLISKMSLYILKCKLSQTEGQFAKETELSKLQHNMVNGNPLHTNHEGFNYNNLRCRFHVCNPFLQTVGWTKRAYWPGRKIIPVNKGSNYPYKGSTIEQPQLIAEWGLHVSNRFCKLLSPVKNIWHIWLGVYLSPVKNIWHICIWLGVVFDTYL